MICSRAANHVHLADHTFSLWGFLFYVDLWLSILTIRQAPVFLMLGTTNKKKTSSRIFPHPRCCGWKVGLSIRAGPGDGLMRATVSSEQRERHRNGLHFCRDKKVKRRKKTLVMVGGWALACLRGNRRLVASARSGVGFTSQVKLIMHHLKEFKKWLHNF